MVDTEVMIARACDVAHAQACAYVWGRQDAGESAKDTGYSMDFANAFAARRRAYEEQGNGVGSMPPLEKAFKEWRETRKIS